MAKPDSIYTPHCTFAGKDCIN